MSRTKEELEDRSTMSGIEEELFRIGDCLDDEIDENIKRQDIFLERFADLEARVKAVALEIGAMREGLAELHEIHEETARSVEKLQTTVPEIVRRLETGVAQISQLTEPIQSIAKSISTIRDDTLGILERLGAAETRLARFSEE